MYITASLVAFAALLHNAWALPDALGLQKRAVATTSCIRDNLYRSLIDPRTSVSASSFCSTYVRSTVTNAATTTATTTATVTITPAAAKRKVEEKRDLAATTYPPARLSSACSCILTGQPIPTTTVYATTNTVTVTSSVAPPGCTNSATIVPNGDFENGLAPWVVDLIYPSDQANTKYISYNVTSPGYNSANAFTVHDNKAGESSKYFELDLSQTLNLCDGQNYNVSAQFYVIDSNYRTPKQTILDIVVDLEVKARSTYISVQGPPVVWSTLAASYSFKPRLHPTRLTVKFIATDLVGVTWGLDNVVITPV